mmetsp:Transcript_36908/g.89954  ORF Transcript_36908/g.89954 Transcript_36908/m.89954 type:complete len:303 (+) Transcript_36908:2062-2970(+)
MSMPRYSAYSSTSETAHLKSYCAQTSVSAFSPCAFFQPISDTTATFIISEEATEMPSATSCWKFSSFFANSSDGCTASSSASCCDDFLPSTILFLAAAASSSALFAASSPAFFFSFSSRFFLAVLRSKESWRARRNRSWRSFSSASLALRSSSSFFALSSSSLRLFSSSIRRFSSSSLRFFSSSIRRLRSASSLRRFISLLARYIRASTCIRSAFVAKYSMRVCSSLSSTPTPKKTFVFPRRYFASGTFAASSIDFTPAFPSRGPPFGRTSWNRFKISSKSKWSGKPLRVDITACTTPEVYS